MNRRDALVTLPLVGLFLAGYVKGSPLLARLPVDLTVAMLVLLLAAAAYELGRTRTALSGIGPLVLMAATFVAGGFGVSGTAYADRKVLLLFGLTLPAAFAAAVVVNTRARAWWVARWTVVGGLGIWLLLYLYPSTASNLYGRLGVEGSDTISTSRAAGAAAVALVALALAGKVRWPLAVALIGVMVWIVLGSGQRGPLVGVAVAVLVMLVARPGVKRLGLLVVAAAGVVLVGPWLLSRTNNAAADRILALFSSNHGESISLRQELYTLAARRAWENPGGLGWGGLENLLPLQQYPHNIALEIAGEGGWLAAAAFALVVVLAFLRLARRSADPAAQALLGLLVFWLANSMFSGDVNDNRAAFALLAVALVAPRWPSADEADGDELAPDVVEQGQRGRQVGSRSWR